MKFHTADLCDAHGDLLQVAQSGLRDFGGQIRFWGAVHTIRTYEDNSFVRRALESDGKGKILIVDGGGSKNCALLGDNLAELAKDNRWSGVVIHGCVRDSAALTKVRVGIKALDVHPRKSVKREFGEENVPVTFCGVTFRPGDYVYADEDGLLVAPEELPLP